MNEWYKDCLEHEGITEKASRSRITRLNRVAREFDINVDIVTDSVENMIELRSRIYGVYGTDVSTAGNLYNSVTKYYKFKNGVEMKRVDRI